MAQRKPQQTISLDEYRKRYQNPAPPQPKKAKRMVLVKTTMTLDEYHALALEKDFMVDLQAELTRYGFLWFHQAPGTDSQRNQGQSGFPDIMAVHPVTGGMFVAELKRSAREPHQPAQDRWLEAYRLTGAEVYHWVPDDWPAILAVITRLSQPHLRVAIAIATMIGAWAALSHHTAEPIPPAGGPTQVDP